MRSLQLRDALGKKIAPLGALFGYQNRAPFALFWVWVRNLQLGDALAMRIASVCSSLFWVCNLRLGDALGMKVAPVMLFFGFGCAICNLGTHLV